MFTSPLIAALFATSAQAATLSICDTGCDHDSLADAVADAVDGDVIELSEGDWPASDLDVEVDLTFQVAAGDEGLVGIEGDNTAAATIWIRDDAVVEFIGIDFFGSEAGSAVVNLSTVTFTDCLFTANDTDFAVFYNLGTMTLQDTQVSGNTAQSLAGAILNEGDLDIIDSDIINNSVAEGGTAPGAILSEGSVVVRIKRSRVADNVGGVGAITADGSDVRLTRATVTDNHGTSKTGGAYLKGAATLNLWTGSTLSGNTSDTTTEQCQEASGSSGCP